MVKDIDVRARFILTKLAHETAKRFGSSVLSAEHIVLTIAMDYPSAAEKACRLLGTNYSEVVRAALGRVGRMYVGASEEEGPLPPDRRVSGVLNYAMWSAELRRSRLCGIGDLFVGAVGRMEPGLCDHWNSRGVVSKVAVAFRRCEMKGWRLQKRSATS